MDKRTTEVETKNKKETPRKSSKYNYSPAIPGLDYSAPLDMPIEEILTRLPKFTLKDIKYLISRGVIKPLPLTLLDFEVLKKVHNIWRTPSAISLMSMGISKTMRQKILQRADLKLNSKLESWLYTRLIKMKSNNKRIYKRALAIEVIKNFKLKGGRKQIEEIIKAISRLNRKINYKNKVDKSYKTDLDKKGR